MCPPVNPYHARRLVMNEFPFRLAQCSIAATALLFLQSDVSAQNSTAPSAPNMAVVATPSSSSVSGDARNEALNDGSNPRNSRGDRRGTYGNWPRTGTQWVQYDWSQPISTKQIEVYWWDDNQGVRLPKASRVDYWDGKGFVRGAKPERSYWHVPVAGIAVG